MVAMNSTFATLNTPNNSTRMSPVHSSMPLLRTRTLPNWYTSADTVAAAGATGTCAHTVVAATAAGFQGTLPASGGCCVLLRECHVSAPSKHARAALQMPLHSAHAKLPCCCCLQGMPQNCYRALPAARVAFVSISSAVKSSTAPWDCKYAMACAQR